MKFEDFLKSGQAKKSARDAQLAKSLIIAAEEDLLFLKELEVKGISARKIVSNYYDVLRSILEAYSSLDGTKYIRTKPLLITLRKERRKFSPKFERFRK